MKLSELLPEGQNAIRDRLQTELDKWEDCSIWWWRKPGDACERMETMHLYFLDFRWRILADEDIDEVFIAWVADLHGYVFEGTDACRIPTSKINVPQYAFLQVYSRARKELREHQEAIEESSLLFGGKHEA